MQNENSPHTKLLYRGLVGQTIWKPDLLNKVSGTTYAISQLIALIDVRFNDLFIGDTIEVPDDDEQAWTQTLNVLGAGGFLPVVTLIEFTSILRATIAPNGTLDLLAKHIKSNFDNIATNLGLVASWSSEAQSMGLVDPSETLIDDIFGLLRGDADVHLTSCFSYVSQMTAIIQSDSDMIDTAATGFLSELAIIAQKIEAEKLALKGVVKQLSLATDAFALQSAYENSIGKAVLDSIVTTTANAILQMTDEDGTEDDDGPTGVGSPDVVITPPAPLSAPVIQPLPDYRR
jgi:hypothetical protein